MSHTPGPWFDDGYRIHAPTDSEDKRNGRVIVEYKHVEDFNPDDARLITRAPEMQEKCEKAVKDWVSVKDRLPEIMPPMQSGDRHSAPVLIAYRWGGESAVRDYSFCVAHLGDFGQGARWRVDGVDGYEWEEDFQDSDVTHWMPLPSAPK